MKYLLDTNICIFMIKNTFPNITKRILSCTNQDIVLSAISVAEMEYGASKSQNREKNRQAVLDFCMNFDTILDFTTEDAEAYGIIRAIWKNKVNSLAHMICKLQPKG